MEYIELRDLQKAVEKAEKQLADAMWIDYQKGRPILSMAKSAGIHRSVVKRILRPMIQAELDRGRAELKAGGFGPVFGASDVELHKAGIAAVASVTSEPDYVEIPAGSESAWRPPGYEPPVHPDWDSESDDD